MNSKVTIEVDRKDDGRWIAENLELPGVLAYGDSCEEAVQQLKLLSRQVLNDRNLYGESPA